MALTETFREIALEKASKQSVMIDALTEEAPILSGLPMEESSDGLSNVYEELTEVIGGDVVDLDAELPTVNSNSELTQVDLSVLGGIIEVGEDKARKVGSKERYFAKKMPTILRITGNDMESGLFYNNFRAFAAANSKLVTATGSANANYTIMAVHYVSGEVTGLFDAEGFGNGKVFDLLPINGGDVYKDADNILVYGLRMKTFFGMQLANARYVSGIVNNDISADDPSGTRKFATEKMMDDMITAARGASANTFIYCHPDVKSYLGTIYKLDKLQLMNGDNQVNSSIEAWRGIPIVTSYNLLQATEANVTI